MGPDMLSGIGGRYRLALRPQGSHDLMDDILSWRFHQLRQMRVDRRGVEETMAQIQLDHPQTDPGFE